MECGTDPRPGPACERHRHGVRLHPVAAASAACPDDPQGDQGDGALHAVSTAHPLDAQVEWLDTPPIRRNRDQTLVSVVIPCYNYGRFLNDAIASVQALTLQDFEIIVVDNGLNDDVTPGVLDALEILDHPHGLTIIRQENQGAPATPPS
jgi:hypothetical protein